MLTTMFLVLLTVAAVNSYKLIDNMEANYYQEEAYKQAGILANELMQEIVRKKFDASVDTSEDRYMDSDEFNWPSQLGAPSTARNYVNPGGAADTYPYKSVAISNSSLNFDDMDDYKDYKRSASAGGLTGFILTVDVYYVSLSNLDVNAYAKRYRKRIVVTVSNSKYLSKDLVFSTIASY